MPVYIPGRDERGNLIRPKHVRPPGTVLRYAPNITAYREDTPDIKTPPPEEDTGAAFNDTQFSTAFRTSSTNPQP